MSTKKDFEKWLSECPVDYYEVFGENTYMFLVNRFEETDTDDDEDWLWIIEQTTKTFLLTNNNFY